MTVTEKLLQDLRDDKNSLEKVIDVLQNLLLVPRILENQQRIIELLQKGGGSSDFLTHISGVSDKLNTLGKLQTSKGKEDVKL